MADPEELKKELIEQYKQQQRKNKTPLDNHEALIIVAALAALTIALVSGKLSETAFSTLMGGFLGYTFGRIFNGWQGKE